MSISLYGLRYFPSRLSFVKKRARNVYQVKNLLGRRKYTKETDRLKIVFIWKSLTLHATEKSQTWELYKTKNLTKTRFFVPHCN